MFAWAKAKKSDHSLADEHDAKELLAALSREDTLPGLQRLSELLDDLKTAQGITVGRRYEIVDAVDRTGRSHYRSALQEFLDHRHRLTKLQANRICTTAGEYLVELAEAYQFCLAAFEAGASGAAALRSQVVRIIGRAIRLRAAALKWDYLRYTKQLGKWAELYRLYQLAEMRGLVQEKVLLYRGGRLSSIEGELMQALMLAAASPQGLLPEQIEAAERIIASLADHLALGNSARAKRPYFFDLASGAPPARELPGIRPPLTARRFGAGAAEAELRNLLRKAQAGTLLRSEFGLQGVSGEMLQTTAQHLVRYWCEPPADRRHVRRRLAAKVVVVHGFEEVAANVGNMLIEYPFVSDQEVWLCENAADGGMAALVKSPHGAWVNVGAVLAYRYPDSATWNAGIVRHMSEEDAQTLCVGVETVARGGVAVSVSGGKRRADVHDDGALCVWLAEAGCEAGEMKLLMPARLYARSSALAATLYDRRYLLIPLALLESGPDYELGLFKAVRG